MGEHNSPYFDQGKLDGQADTDALQSCPPQEISGMDADKEWSVMYRRGYNLTYDPAPHRCTPACESKART